MLGAVGALCTLSLMIQQANTQNPADWKAIDRALGRSGNLQGETYRVGFPRNDLHVTVGAVTVRPSLALGSWVAFEQTGDSTAMLMGDLVLLPVEVGSVIDALQRGGIEQTALHNHLASESPHLVYLHIGGRGRPVALATAVHEALAFTRTPPPATSAAPWKIYNIGSNSPEELVHVVSLLEREFGRTAVKEMVPMQPGDVPATYADIEDLTREIGFRPATKIEEGIARFAKWYRDYHNV